MNNETEIYKGIEITINKDEFSENPWEAWDGCVPLITKTGRHGFTTDYSHGHIMNFLWNFLSDNQMKYNQAKLLNLIGEDVDTFRENFPTDSYDRTDIIADWLHQWLKEDLDHMEEFCLEFGIKHYRGTSQGYCQGDWADCFFCYTPEWEAITGRSYESVDESTFETAMELFSAWAWGDVYWYDIEETGDSCGGFYGNDHETNGLMDMARTEIDGYLERKRKTKADKIKALIKNDVPLNYREAIFNRL